MHLVRPDWLHHSPVQSPNPHQHGSHLNSVMSGLVIAQFEAVMLVLMYLRPRLVATVNNAEIQSSRPDTSYWQSEFYPAQPVALTDAHDLQGSARPRPESG